MNRIAITRRLQSVTPRNKHVAFAYCAFIYCVLSCVTPSVDDGNKTCFARPEANIYVLAFGRGFDRMDVTCPPSSFTSTDRVASHDSNPCLALNSDHGLAFDPNFELVFDQTIPEERIFSHRKTHKLPLNCYIT
ncbi:hypothetical protein EVAR_27979_1 [Eumeta japonica]|uniref:Uncharacterized protein n=1 Tax=Eumeta variegata TaxID=151549 RepID=A0A4C1WC13_EUMVA|nr:hypothetical protein EVAR_27979_1 [Eumeta japonica]